MARVMVLASVASAYCEAQDSPGEARSPAAEQETEVAAIRAAVEEYVAAFNSADAAAVASCWSETGEYVAPDGLRLSGSVAIEKHFRESFEQNPGLKLVVVIDSIRLLDAQVALEGTAVIAGGWLRVYLDLSGRSSQARRTLAA